MKSPKPKWIAATSPSKRASRAAYHREARRVVDVARSKRVWCPVALLLWGEIRLVEEVHHGCGRGCDALLHDQRGWFLVCRASHVWIENHKAEAREHGWVCPVGKFGTPFKPDEPPMPGSVAELQAKGEI